MERLASSIPSRAAATGSSSAPDASSRRQSVPVSPSGKMKVRPSLDSGSESSMRSREMSSSPEPASSNVSFDVEALSSAARATSTGASSARVSLPSSPSEGASGADCSIPSSGAISSTTDWAAPSAVSSNPSTGPCATTSSSSAPPASTSAPSPPASNIALVASPSSGVMFRSSSLPMSPTSMSGSGCSDSARTGDSAGGAAGAIASAAGTTGMLPVTRRVDVPGVSKPTSMKMRSFALGVGRETPVVGWCDGSMARMRSSVAFAS